MYTADLTITGISQKNIDNVSVFAKSNCWLSFSHVCWLSKTVCLSEDLFKEDKESDFCVGQAAVNWQISSKHNVTFFHCYYSSDIYGDAFNNSSSLWWDWIVWNVKWSRIQRSTCIACEQCGIICVCSPRELL